MSSPYGMIGDYGAGSGTMHDDFRGDGCGSVEATDDGRGFGDAHDFGNGAGFSGTAYGRDAQYYRPSMYIQEVWWLRTR